MSQALGLLFLWGCASQRVVAPSYEGPPRQLAVLAINDVYRIDGLPLEDRGGLARGR